MLFLNHPELQQFIFLQEIFQKKGRTIHLYLGHIHFKRFNTKVNLKRLLIALA